MSSPDQRHDQRRRETRRYDELRNPDSDTSRLSRARARGGDIVSGVGSSVASLISSEETDPDPEAYTRSSTEIYSTNVDVNRPDPETEDFWIEYENNPIISTQVDHIPEEVFEGGYWVEADSDETQEEISEFLENIGIQAGQTHRGFKTLGSQAIIQNLIRGTFLGEKVMEDDRHVAINPVNVSTVEMYTKPGSNILVPPDFNETNTDTLLKVDEESQTAAYVQYDEQFTRWQDKNERRFTDDQMLHWARNPDIGDLRGRSVVEPVFERSRAMREKLQDNDLAIAMKAWPMILFQMGTEDRPWNRDQMDDFMADYDEETLGPGMFQGVPGDIEVHEFAGETADIEGHVQTDVDLIVSGLPGPKYALGSFASGDENEAMAGAHERQFRKLIRSLRRDLENLFTPYLKDVAESWGYDPSGLDLTIGRPAGEVAPEDIQGSIIRYQSDSGNNDDPEAGDTVDGTTVIPDSSAKPADEIDDEDSDGGNSDDGSESASASAPVQRPHTHGDNTRGSSRNQDSGRFPDQQSIRKTRHTQHTSNTPITELASPTLPNGVETDRSVDELSHSGTVSTSASEAELADEISNILIDARETAFELLELRYSSRRIPDGRGMAAEFEGQVGTKIREEELSRTVSNICNDVLEQTLETLDQNNTQSRANKTLRTKHRSVLSARTERILGDVKDLATEIGREFNQQLDVTDGSDFDAETITERLSTVYDDGTLEFRAQLLARMNIQTFVNQTKLAEFRADDSVIGVELTSECTENTHRLTADLASCNGGEPARAVFDSEQSIGEQLQAQTNVKPPVGFNPLPNVPPFHFNDRTEIVPIRDDN